MAESPSAELKQPEPDYEGLEYYQGGMAESPSAELKLNRCRAHRLASLRRNGGESECGIETTRPRLSLTGVEGRNGGESECGIETSALVLSPFRIGKAEWRRVRVRN